MSHQQSWLDRHYGIKIIRHEAPRPKPPHLHVLPNWIDRWRLGLGIGAIVECSTCGQRFEFVREPKHGRYWKAIKGETS